MTRHRPPLASATAAWRVVESDRCLGVKRDQWLIIRARRPPADDIDPGRLHQPGDAANRAVRREEVDEILGVIKDHFAQMPGLPISRSDRDGGAMIAQALLNRTYRSGELVLRSDCQTTRSRGLLDADSPTISAERYAACGGRIFRNNGVPRIGDARKCTEVIRAGRIRTRNINLCPGF